jgi:hypothetical protein
VKRVIITVVCALGVLVSGEARAQSEQELRAALEGQYVVVKMDLPATQYGLDVYPLHENAIDFKAYSDRIREFGVALREGQRVMVTTVRVKKKNVELQLGGGGYGVFGDDSGSVYVPTVEKTRREKDLERWIKDEPDYDRRRRMQRELDELRRDRQRDERDRQMQKESLEAEKKRDIADKRLNAGSRVNIWYSDGKFADPVPTLGQVKRILFKVIDFGPVESTRSRDDDEQDGQVARVVQKPTPKSSAKAGGIARGMSRDDVHAALGEPVKSTSGRQGDLATVIETFESDDTVTEVTFVGDVVVKFTTASK